MAEPTRRVAVTGASGYIGSKLIERLEAEPQIERILAIDRRPLPRSYGPKVVFQVRDISGSIGHHLLAHRVEAMAHLAFLLNPGHDNERARRVNVDGAERVLVGCNQAGVRRIVYLSSTSVYGAHPDNPPMLTEDSPLRPPKGFQYSEHKVRAEALVERFADASPGVATTILRVCPVMGPNANNFISNAFLRPVLVGVIGCDPPMQLVHEDDLAYVLARCLMEDVPGLYNVASDRFIHWSEMARILGCPLLRLPAPLLYGATALAWTLRLQSYSPASGLNFIRYRWTASTEKLKTRLRVRFRYTSTQAWEDFARRQEDPTSTVRRHR